MLMLQIGMTPLMLAAHQGFSEIINALLNKGANIEAVDNVSPMNRSICYYIICLYFTDPGWLIGLLNVTSVCLVVCNTLSA